MLVYLIKNGLVEQGMHRLGIDQELTPVLGDETHRSDCDDRLVGRSLHDELRLTPWSAAAVLATKPRLSPRDRTRGEHCTLNRGVAGTICNRFRTPTIPHDRHRRAARL